jgi:hypothetical protein
VCEDEDEGIHISSEIITHLTQSSIITIDSFHSFCRTWVKGFALEHSLTTLSSHRAMAYSYWAWNGVMISAARSKTADGA